LPEAVDQVGKEDIRRFILYLQKEALNPRTGEHLSTVTVQADGYRSCTIALMTDREQRSPRSALKIKIYGGFPSTPMD